MEFASRLIRCPLPFDAAAGREARDALSGLAPELGELIAGAAGCSPFLKGLMATESAWLTEALSGPPEAALEEVLAGAAAPLPALGAALRRAKRLIRLAGA